MGLIWNKFRPKLFQPYWRTQAKSLDHLLYISHLLPRQLATATQPPTKKIICCGFPDFIEDDGAKLVIVWDGLGLVIFVVDWFLLMEEIIWEVFWYSTPEHHNNFICCGFPGFTHDDGEKLVWDGLGLIWEEFGYSTPLKIILYAVVFQVLPSMMERSLFGNRGSAQHKWAKRL